MKIKKNNDLLFSFFSKFVAYLLINRMRMKTILFYFLLFVLAVSSCRLKQNDNDSERQVMENTDGTTPVCTVDTVMSSAIFWIDKAEVKHCKEWGFRTVKAKVFIHEDGKVDLQAFVKKQSPDLEKYIRHHLSKFRVSEKMLENEYIHPGEQFVQLRCLWEKLKGK